MKTFGVTPQEVISQPPTTSETVAKMVILATIVSASRLMRDGILSLLSSHMDIHLVASYTGLPHQPITRAEREIVLLDSSIGKDTALVWLAFCREHDPPLPVVMLELPNDPETIVDYIGAGAAGYTVQNAAASDIATAIKNVHQGLTICSPEVTSELVARLQSTAKHAHDDDAELPLTPRECEVLCCVAGGMSNQDIADDLCIDVRTVKHHVHNILRKLDLKRRWDAAKLALDLGWTPRVPDKRLGDNSL